jgi:hypothetical protein
MAVDFTGLSAIIPVFGFLLVFVVVYALLSKTKILGENKFVHIFTSFCVAILFLVSANAVEYVQVITPWFVAFILSMLFILILVGLMRGKIEDFIKPGVAWIVVILLILIFVGSAVYVFADIINKYLAGPKEFLLQPQIFGTIILILLTLFASWLITKKSSS